MPIGTILLTIVGLCLFEIVSSIDNAVINAEMLSTMGPKSRRWFLSWGFLLAIVVVRGLLPWAIVWATLPGLGPIGALTAAFSGNSGIRAAVAAATPVLLAGGSLFLLLLFLHWLFLERKHISLPFERFLSRASLAFYPTAAAVLSLVVWASLRFGAGTRVAFAAIAGAAAFFIMHGFRDQAERAEKRLAGGKASDLSKLVYLEVIDAAFSVDGVLGAFAFTVSVPLILVGNGIGAFILRQLTVGNIERIKRYAYLKNGAMYSIFALGCIMLADAFGAPVPEWLSPLATIAIVGYFFLRSKKSVYLSHA